MEIPINICAVTGLLLALLVVRHNCIKNMAQAVTNFFIINRRGDLNAFDGIARHEIGRSDINLLVCPYAEAIDT